MEEARELLVTAERLQRERATSEEALRAKLARVEHEKRLLQTSHDELLESRQAEAKAQSEAAAEREAEAARLRAQLEEQAREMAKKRSALQQTAALGQQLAGIQSLLTELGGMEHSSVEGGPKES